MRSHDLQAVPLVLSTRAAPRPRAEAARKRRIVAAAALLSLTMSACSVSYPLFDPKDDITTGSVDAPAPAAAAPRDPVVSAPLAPLKSAAGPSEPPADAVRPAAYAPKDAADAPAITPADWIYARGALSLAMGADAVDASIPWANPDTGAYGSFKASAGSVVERGATCRPFAASHLGGGREQRLEGTACRTAAGHWEAVAIKATASRTL
jgi:hypothetical protein